MFRKIVYGMLGFSIGAVTGFVLSAYIVVFIFHVHGLSANYGYIFSFIFAGFATVVGIRIAERKNLKEKQYESAVSETEHGNAFIANCIVGIQFLVNLFVLFVIILIFIINIRLLHLSNKDILNFVRIHYLFVLIVTLLLQIVSSWLGVSYVVHKNYLKPFHSITKIFPWVVMWYFVFEGRVLTNNPLSFVIGLIIYSATLFYFLNRARNRLVQKQQALT